MSLDTTIREFEPGTTGWTASDLDDPVIEAAWDAGAYEIVEGVLTKMAPAYLDSTVPLGRLIFEVKRHLVDRNLPGDFGPEADYIIAPKRVARVDAVFMTPDEFRLQQEANARRGRRRVKFGRLLVRPTLVIESISIGHESHDRELKRTWYAEAGVPNYWLFDAFDRSVESLVLDGKEYRTDCLVRDEQEFRPSLFPGLIVQLKSIWI
jgi:Uma2 family endonuclease